MSSKNIPEEKKKRLLAWWWLALYVSLIFISAPYALKLWNFWEKKLKINLTMIFSLFGVGIFFLLFYFLIKTKTQRLLEGGIILTGIFLGSTSLFLFFTSHPIERIHLFEYGFLSYLVFQALKYKGRGKRNYIWGISIVILIGVFDEVFQWFLPQRFGDIRDVFLNSFSGLFGFLVIALFNSELLKVKPP
jgi:glycopeptide antibiotics resistance protein